MVTKARRRARGRHDKSVEQASRRDGKERAESATFHPATRRDTKSHASKILHIFLLT